MTDACVGVVSPGEMGAAVGRSLTGAGRRVVSVLVGRSQDTVERARQAAIATVEDLGELVATADVVVSIVPPAQAGDVAGRLADAISTTRSTPLVVEANAIGPARAEELGRLLDGAGAAFVDGDVIGGPPGPGRPPTRIYLSGPHAPRAAELLGADELQAVVLEGPATAASSLKMAYASWSKGSAALVLAARALARRLGVEEALLGEWALSQHGLTERCDGAARRCGRAWRFVAEMEEIAATFEQSGLPGGFGRGAADTYGRLISLKGEATPSAEAVLALLAGDRGDPGHGSP